LPKFSKFPHRGDVVDNELKLRGLGDLLSKQELWLKENWNNVVNDEIFIKNHHHVHRRVRRPKFTMLGLIRKLATN
jgi:hypothetical protein